MANINVSSDWGTGSSAQALNVDSGSNNPGALAISKDNVGVGTTAPAQKLHAKTIGGNTLQYGLEVQNPDGTDSGGTATGVLFASETQTFGKGALVYERQASWGCGAFHFLQNKLPNSNLPALTDAVMSIKNDGKVGIGITSPRAALEINGDLITKGPWFDVRAYGATGNGTTDDTAAIQGALDAAFAAGGGTVFMPRGTFKTSDTLVIKSCVTLAGAGLLSTTIDGSSLTAGKAIIASYMDSNWSWNNLQRMITLKDFRITGGPYLTLKTTATYAANLTGVYFKGVLQCSMENVNVEYCRVGIRLKAWVMNLYNCFTRYCNKGIDASWYSETNPWNLSQANCENSLTGSIMLYGCDIESSFENYTISAYNYNYSSGIGTYTVNCPNYAAGDWIYIYDSAKPSSQCAVNR